MEPSTEPPPPPLPPMGQKGWWKRPPSCYGKWCAVQATKAKKAPFKESRVARWIKLGSFSALRYLLTGLCFLSHLASPPCVQVPMPPSMSRFPPPSLPPSTASCMYHGNVDPPNDAAKRPAAAVTEKGNSGGAAAAAAEGLHFLEWLAALGG